LEVATTTFKKHLHIKSLIYFRVQTILLIHKLKAVSCYKLVPKHPNTAF
jgi:hypothetical protein